MLTHLVWLLWFRRSKFSKVEVFRRFRSFLKFFEGRSFSKVEVFRRFRKSKFFEGQVSKVESFEAQSWTTKTWTGQAPSQSLKKYLFWFYYCERGKPWKTLFCLNLYYLKGLKNSLTEVEILSKKTNWGLNYDAVGLLGLLADHIHFGSAIFKPF